MCDRGNSLKLVTQSESLRSVRGKMMRAYL